ncbi:MAG: LacI family transcriptional regulator [Anaerolinea sp.]|nr:LacI family transcriptional regulator [Anaerolinea sp.]
MGTKTVKTIEDIAKLANVSKSTVSRALNDSSLINPETKERIKAIAEEHNFCMNLPARNLSRRQSCTVGFVTHSHQCGFTVEDMFGLEIMSAIGTGLDELNYDLLMIHMKPRDTSWAHQYFDSGRVDGFILMKTGRGHSYSKMLSDMEAPFIIWGIPDPDVNCCTVTGDNLSGAMLATEHLIRIGRKKIAILGGPEYDLEGQLRMKGYETAMRNSGRNIDPNLMVNGDYLLDSGVAGMKQLLEKTPDLDAVFVCGDVMAIGAIDVLQSSGRRVPEDVAVVGYDDLAIATYNNLPLTTVRQNIQMSGKLLAQNLVQSIKTGVITHVTVPVELVIRKSA